MNKESFLEPVYIFRDGEQALGGRLIDADDSLLLLHRDGVPYAVPFSDAVSIRMPGRPVAGRAFVYGMFLAAYVSNHFFWSRENQIGSFLNTYPDEKVGFLASNLGTGLVIGSIVYLFASASDQDEEEFHVLHGNVHGQNEKNRFMSFVKRDDSKPSMHVSVQMSTVAPVESNRAMKLLNESGFSDVHSNSISWQHRALTDFNILRKLQATFSIRPDICFGLSYMDLAERYSTYSATGKAPDGSRQEVEFMQDLTGWYAVGTYEPLLRHLNQPLEWKIGVGLGVTAIDGHVASLTAVHDLTDKTLSALLFSEFNLYVYSGLSLGLTAEYVYVSGMEIGPLQGVTSENSMINFNSTSWGLVLGVHF
ncbi:MAG: hypothetical protein C0600_07090 [Ignavibacteria bacterium]|nr:MAG: hypothetical protein C0600_07090 [Ignavibacteria bacterium]